MADCNFYIWSVADLTTAQAALAFLNAKAQFPITGCCQTTDFPMPGNTKMVRWDDSVETFINSTVGFKEVGSTTFGLLGMDATAQQTFLTTYNPTITEFDMAWRTPKVFR